MRFAGRLCLTATIAVLHLAVAAALAEGLSASPQTDGLQNVPRRERATMGGVQLYFTNPDHTGLTAQERSIKPMNDAVALGRQILEALMTGPDGELLPVFPKETRLRTFFIAADRTAYVDLDASFLEHYPHGAMSELLTIYAMVNSLTLNVPQIESVRFLIGGNEQATFAGHVSLTNAFKANMLLIK